MRTRPTAVLRSVLLTLVALSLLACGEEDEQGPPKHEGKTQAEWEALLESGTVDERKGAVLALPHFGPETLQQVEKQLEAEEKAIRLAAIRALGAYGEGAQNHVPQMVLWLKEEGKENAELRQSAGIALGKIGPSVMPHLSLLLDSKEVRHRRRALMVMRNFLDRIPNAVPLLLPLVEDKNWTVRMHAVAALGKVGKGDEAAAAAVLECMDDKNPEVVYRSACALGDLEAESDEAAKRLAKMLYSPMTRYRWAAAYALGLMGETSYPYLERLDDVSANDAQPTVQVQAALAHWRVKRTSAVALPRLRALLHSTDPMVRRDAVRAIGLMESAGAEAVPDLIALLSDREVRRVVPDALAAMGPAAGEAVTHLEAMIKDPTASDYLVDEAKNALSAIRGES